MEVTVAGKSDFVDFSDKKTIATIVEELNTKLKTKGYRVGKLELDGHQLDQNWNSQVGDKTGEQFDTLEVEAISPRKISVGTLDELQEHFEELLNPLEEVSKNFQKGNNQEGYSMLQEVLQHLQTFMQTINHIVVVTNLDLTEETMDGDPLQSFVKDTANMIVKLEGAVQDENMTMLSDASQYELQPLIEDWIDICDQLQQRVKDKWPVPEQL